MCIYVFGRVAVFTTVNICDDRLMMTSHHPQSACDLIISFILNWGILSARLKTYPDKPGDIFTFVYKEEIESFLF